MRSPFFRKSRLLMCRSLSAFLIAALALASACCHATGVKVIYPAYETATDTRFDDIIEILRTALDETKADFGDYELTPSSIPMNEARYMAELENQGNPGSLVRVNVTWSSTSIDKEKTLQPIRIPLRKGILGYRIALIAKDKQEFIDKVKTVADLSRFSIGQGIGWGDVKLYQANGLNVRTSQYDSLFGMTALGRFDLFPRGISEVFSEYAQHAKDTPNLAIEKNLLIYYPWPYYFFFNKNDSELKKRIEAGIRKMRADGTFDAIFKKYNSAAIDRADFNHRRIIVLKNPLLPKETPLGDSSLWFDPLAMALRR